MIHVVDLHKSHGDLAVLKGITLEVDKGEVHVVVGPSGGGKSTFLRCVNGLERFDAGEIIACGVKLDAKTDARRDAQKLEGLRRRVGFVFQQFNLFPHMTALENLVAAPTLVLGESRAAAEARAHTLLLRMGLEGKAASRPSQLSGGQQQRVAIARALMMKPEVILFDEPTSALDPLMAAEVLAVMTELAKGGQTMIVVTHSMGFARGVATRVHLFAGGLDVESAPPERFFGAPEHPETRRFLAHVS
ncbi:MAG TPA: amino acid ABC transporter ATP-binding protein [Polyangia bacterium]|nr:amino acid ABC transporter ATP-binding protein [Polyangia bacterium]